MQILRKYPAIWQNKSSVKQTTGPRPPLVLHLDPQGGLLSQTPQTLPPPHVCTPSLHPPPMVLAVAAYGSVQCSVGSISFIQTSAAWPPLVMCVFILSACYGGSKHLWVLYATVHCYTVRYAYVIHSLIINNVLNIRRVVVFVQRYAHPTEVLRSIWL